MKSDVGFFKLVPDLIPIGSHGLNLRSMLTQDQWDFLRRQCYADAGHRCEICGGAYGYDRLATKWPVECHEMFVYDGSTRTQKLVKLVALCKPCHMAQHPGFARSQGLIDDVLCHIMNVNGMTYSEAVGLLNRAIDLCAYRSRVQWEIDISVALEALPPELR